LPVEEPVILVVLPATISRRIHQQLLRLEDMAEDHPAADPRPVKRKPRASAAPAITA
jgi:hypothetical protein